MEDELKCALCPRTAPTEEAIAAGWEASFYHGPEGPGEGAPICPECVETRCYLRPADDFYTLKPEFRYLVKE